MQPLRAPGSVGSAAAIALAKRADMLCWAVWALGLVNVWRIQVLYASILAPLRLGLVFTALGLFAWFQANDGWRKLSTIQSLTLVRLVLLLFVVMLLGVPFGLYAGNSFKFVRNGYLGVFLYFLLTIASIRSRKDVERLLLVHVIGASIFTLVVLARFGVGASGRLSNLPSYDANDIAMLLVCTMPIAVYFMRRGASPLMRPLMVGAFVIFAILLVRSGSRGGFIGFVATMTYMMVRFRGISVRIRTAAAVAAAGTILVAGSDQYWEMMRTILNPKEDYNYTEAGGRKQIWERGIGYMLANPFVGVGPNNFGAAEAGSELNLQRSAQGKGWVWAAPHNSFVQVGAETGVTGLVLFISLLVIAFRYTMRRASRRVPEDPDAEALRGALAGALVGYCFAGFFLTQGYSAYLYSLLAIVAGLMKLDVKTRQPITVPAAKGRRLKPVRRQVRRT
jgi:hypothetical protein